MRARLPSAWLAWAAVLALAGPNPVSAKPPDLPQHTRFTCEPPAESECPYLREKAHQQAAPDADVAEPASVLENLRRLERAAKLYRQGQRYELEFTKLDAACRCFEKVKQLCPGSPLDAQASAELRRIRHHQADMEFFRLQMQGFIPTHDVPAGEEQEPQDTPEASQPQATVRPGCCALMCDVLSTLRSHLCCDVDCSKPGVVRAQCSLTDVGLTCRLTYDGGFTLECGPAPLVLSVMRGLGCLKKPAAEPTGP